MSGSDRFQEAIEKILADQSPREEVEGLDAEELRMIRMAQLIRGSQARDPQPDFEEQLLVRLKGQHPRVSRRTAFLSGLGALAAGILAGVGIDRSTRGSSSSTAAPSPLVTNGRWIAVAHVTDVPIGAVHAFSTGAVQGFVVNSGGQLRAMSRICTHMGCALKFSAAENHLVCPCHGAEFDMRGRFLYGALHRRYGSKLPALPSIDVRVNGEAIEVWAV